MLLHIRSGETYPVSFLALQPYDVDLHMSNWLDDFDWTVYFGQPEVEVYKMVITGNDVIQGAVALEPREDHIHVHLIESAPHNRMNHEFKYIGIHLIAFACHRSRELGHEGFVTVQAKTNLVEYYRRAGARHMGGGRMIIDDIVARHLIAVYLN